MNTLFADLRNLFKSIDNYNCFVCSDTNPIGLNLDIRYEDTTTYAIFNLSNLYSGFPSVIHGGIQATIIDEIGFWSMFNDIRQLGFTKSLSVEYLSQIQVDNDLKVVGEVIEYKDNIVKVKVEIISDSTAKTRGIVEYKTINNNLVKKYFGEDFSKKFNKIIENN
ncbi:MAG: hotdog domain-containing protein [Thermodesulfobacteriota bacterium]|nr:hotdog domain-containing protein [Thermodesulfobacteriota bacterium]MEE2975440.1 hotdog domain-containing protein [Thermodesulfobacteriota bacterium]